MPPAVLVVLTDDPDNLDIMADSDTRFQNQLKSVTNEEHQNPRTKGTPPNPVANDKALDVNDELDYDYFDNDY